ncbi:hypothetical protein GEMRC1_007702 [Eukaryota sp. GEM-RC1]
MLNLGCCYSEGEVVVMNDEETFNWLKRAADLNNSEALAVIGLCYCEQDNPEEAIKFVRRAVELGNPLGMSAMAYIYGLKSDMEKAMKYFSMAVDGGCSLGMWGLGCGYIEESCSELEQNPIKGFELLQKSAELNNTDAIDALIKYYESITFKDLKKKSYWEQKKKELGDCRPTDRLKRRGLI